MPDDPSVDADIEWLRENVRFLSAGMLELELGILADQELLRRFNGISERVLELTEVSLQGSDKRESNGNLETAWENTPEFEASFTSSLIAGMSSRAEEIEHRFAVKVDLIRQYNGMASTILEEIERLSVPLAPLESVKRDA
jgi:hypothetical protein